MIIRVREGTESMHQIRGRLTLAFKLNPEALQALNVYVYLKSAHSSSFSTLPYELIIDTCTGISLCPP